MKNVLLPLSLTCILFTSLSAVNYNLKKSTPVGSWQVREEITTDEKGKQSVQVIKTALVDKEKRGGVAYVWFEVNSDTFKMKKGKKGKQQGDTMRMKFLVEEKLLNGNPEEIMSNLSGVGKEIIMQTGDQDPMVIEEGGMMGGAMLQAMGASIDYKFDDKGSEKVSVPAGSFKCRVIEGSGNVEMKVLFKKMSVQSTSKQWMSESVPFGIVKAETTAVTNGKTTTTSVQLLEYGKSGAKSEITGTPQKMPGLGDIFGG
ncbi:MAG: hypothetical protein MI748_19900 [Opitutales bacterium]|nr:hypothetical protein [Opitutales bacterium]